MEKRKLPCPGTTETFSIVENSLRSGKFDLAVREGGRLLEQILREMYQTIYFSVSHQERILIQKAENDIGKGIKGVNAFSLGEMVRLYLEAKFQKKWQSQFYADPLLFSGVDLGTVVSSRNRCVHPDVTGSEQSISPCQAELCVSILRSFLVATGYMEDCVKQVSDHAQPDLRSLWQIQEPRRLVVIVANSSHIPTGEYLRPATGIGQVRALSCAFKSLIKAYNDVDIRNIYLSTDHLQDHLENDLILLGGPKNNEVTKEYLELILKDQPAKVIGSKIYWRENAQGNWSDEAATEYWGEVRDESVYSDYGLIVRARNVFSQEERTVVLFSGSHTYGTLAAAKYFVEKLQSDYPDETSGGMNLSILVRCEVRNEYPFGINVERTFFWT
jgi:hypothetical protein